MRKPAGADATKGSDGTVDESAQSISSAKDHSFLLSVGQYIRSARLAANLSANDVAEKAGCSASWLYSVEVGQKNFTIVTFLRVLEALDLDLREVFISGLEARHMLTAQKLQELNAGAQTRLVTLARVVSELRSITDESAALLEADRAASAPPPASERKA